MEIVARSRSHFFGLLYEFLLIVRTPVAEGEHPGIAYALHNLPSILDDEHWTDMHSEAAWNEILGAAKLAGARDWLEKTDEKLRDLALSGTPPVPKWQFGKGIRSRLSTDE